MIARQANDRCFSTTPGWGEEKGGVGNPFNFDGVERDEIDADLARSAFDFEILKKPSYDAEGRRIPKQYHLVRSDDNEFIPSGAIGEKFTPVQHRDVLEYILNDVMPEIPEIKLELCGTLHGGGTGLIAATFGDAFKVEGDTSANTIRLFFANPSNGTSSLKLGFTAVRVKCENSLMAAIKEVNADGWKIKHTPMAIDKTKTVVLGIQKQAIAALEMKRMCQQLGMVGIDTETFRQCLDSVYPLYGIEEDSPRYLNLVKVRNSVIEQFEAGETAQSMTKKTAWTVFNSFTYPIFNPNKLRSNTDRAQIAYKGMTSDTGKKVRGIFDKVYAIAARKVA